MRFLKLAVYPCLLVFAGITTAQTIQINRDNKTIAISTTDEATATADIAAVTVGFQIFGPDSDAHMHARAISRRQFSRHSTRPG
jgi:hypothetical protein